MTAFESKTKTYVNIHGTQDEADQFDKAFEKRALELKALGANLSKRQFARAIFNDAIERVLSGK
ncbi:hypothetical protein [Marinicellulosiphila megalodicopiae]|uniref:hypothetical protein n=1 Tax=Marinicellulosiphila megalodicopiae TaxID=2724896 RepID=UPI003BB1E503